MEHASLAAAPTMPKVTISSEQPFLDRTFADSAFAAIETYPQTGAFGRAYYPAIHGNRDSSFAVILNSTAALICLCAPLDNTISFYGMPLRLVARRDLDESLRCAAIEAAFSYLDEIARRDGLREVSVLDQATELAASIEMACRARGAAMQSHPVAHVDLTAGLAAWRAALRKSSRSLINWGRRNLSIVCIDNDNPDRELFEQYRAFHAHVAGRVTRSLDSWNVMYEWIARGGGELVLAYFEGKLIAGSMFIDGTEISIYASGVYDRTRFDKPLAHYPVWLGIEHACARGMKTLELGAVPERGTASDKEYQIGFFKRGFATHVTSCELWRWSPSMAMAAV